MKSFRNILITFIVLPIIMACNDDFLETEPLTEISEAALWQDVNLVRSFINNIYLGVPEPFRRGRLTSNLVDEADYRGNTASLNFNNCIINQDATPMWLSMYYDLQWGDFYRRIRYCNYFLENIERIENADDELINKMIGEVVFLRAYLYHNMVTIWGGVPIITKTYELTDDFNVERDTYESCVEFIVEECNKAASLLPLVQDGSDRGRVTKGAALALKSRVLLYAASALHNTNHFNSFSNPELLGYVAGNQEERWIKARDAAKEVMDLGLYSLYKENPAPGDSIAQNLVDYFITQDFTEEDIWYKFFMEEKSEQMIGLYSAPNGYHGWGTQAPIGDLVDDYEMADGTSFDWQNPEHASEPYKNRDQRFYASIFFEGAQWRERPGDVSGDPEGVIQVGTWEVWDAENNRKIEKHGLDTRSGGIEEWNGSYTGYYMRKFLDPAKDVSFIEGGGGGYQGVPYRFFRFGEILLNYAEACIELGEYDEALNALNRIRKRAGQPEIEITGDDLRDKYRNERRIELAFEEHRIHDVRRWMIGPEAYKPVKRAKVVYKLLPDNTTSTTPSITHEIFQERSWDDKAYFMPIARDEINKNNALIQNPGY